MARLGSLSVIVITRNEERNIVDCLESVKWADEIVVVDSGSNDRTVEMAQRFTSKVHRVTWQGYSASKNFGLSQCSSDWILWLDADERVPEELGEEIRAALCSNDSGLAGYQFPRKAIFLGKWIKHCGWYPGYVLRLFRRNSGTFSKNLVHERVDVQGDVGTMKSDLLHLTDPDLGHYFMKFDSYTTLAASDMYSRGEPFRLTQLLIRPPWTFIRMFFLNAGFLDGIHGLILSALSAYYVFTKYAKLWELSISSKRSKG